MAMRFIRSTAVTVVALAFAFTGVAAAAQKQTAPQRPPQSSSQPVESPAADEQTAAAPVFHRPVVRVGQNYAVRSGDVVYEVQSVLADLTIDGRVESDVVVTLGSVHLGSTAVVDGSLVVIGGSAVVAEGASVHGDFAVIGGVLDAPASFAPGGTQIVAGTPAIGQSLKSLVPWLTHGLLWGRLIVPGLGWIWAIVAIVFVVGLTLNVLFDRPVRACVQAVVERPLSSFLLGLFVLLLTPVALAIIGASVIGLAIVPFVVCAVIAAAIVGKVGVARAIGGVIVKEPLSGGRIQSIAAYTIGFALLCLAYMVPLVGLVTWAITGALGLGAAAVTFRVALKREHPARARVPEITPPPPATPAATLAAAPEPAYEPAAERLEVSPVASSAPPAAVVPYARAAFLDRVAAFALDCILVAIAIQVLGLGRYDGAFFLWLFIYHVAFWAWQGTTMGGIVCGLRVVRTQGTDLRVVDAVVRGLASIFSIAALGIGCLWMLNDPERQMWHDKIAGTFVVKVPRELLLA